MVVRCAGEEAIQIWHPGDAGGRKQKRVEGVLQLEHLQHAKREQHW